MSINCLKQKCNVLFWLLDKYKKKQALVLYTGFRRYNRDIMAKEMDGSPEVGLLELQSSYYIYFQNNAFAKGITPIIPQQRLKWYHWMSMILNEMRMWHYVGGTPGRRSLCLFRRETKQSPELKISDKTGSGREKTSWQRNRERGSWQRNRERGS